MEIASFLDIGQFAFLAVVASVGVAVMMRYLQKERANGSSSDKQIEEIKREI